jgi:hypothetical protein
LAVKNLKSIRDYPSINIDVTGNLIFLISLLLLVAVHSGKFWVAKNIFSIVSKEIKAEIGEIIFLSYFLAKRVKSQRGRN